MKFELLLEITKQAKLEKVITDLKIFANEWKIVIAEEGEASAKKQFKKLVLQAKKLGIKNVTKKFPDGKKIPGV